MILRSKKLEVAIWSNSPDGEGTNYTYRLIRVVFITFFYPIITALIVVSLIDSLTDNDYFAAEAVRNIESGYYSENIKNIALVTFDRNYTHDSSFPESREDIIQLTELLINHGAKFVVLDYVFDYSKDVTVIPRLLANKIVVGSQVQLGKSVREVHPPKNFLSDEVVRYNWGDLYLYDTADRYGEVNSLVYYYQDEKKRYPSLSLAAYNRANDGNNYQLRDTGMGIPERLNANSRYWLSTPNNISDLADNTFSAWYLREQLKYGFVDISDKVVFVASTWDINEDHFYIGANSTGTFIQRILNWSGLISTQSVNGKEPGVYAHIISYLNLIDEKNYVHPSAVNGFHYKNVSLITTYLIFIFIVLIFYVKLLRFFIDSKYNVFVFLLSLLFFFFFYHFTNYFSFWTVLSHSYSVNLTIWFLLYTFCLVFICSRRLDENVKNL